MVTFVLIDLVLAIADFFASPWNGEEPHSEPKLGKRTTLQVEGDRKYGEDNCLRKRGYGKTVKRDFRCKQVVNAPAVPRKGIC